MKPKLDPIEEAFRQIHRERCRVWRANNPEKSRAASRKWNAKHPEDKKLAVRMWKFFNREKYLAGQRKWYRENPNYQREYRAKRRAEMNAPPRDRESGGGAAPIYPQSFGDLNGDSTTSVVDMEAQL